MVEANKTVKMRGKDSAHIVSGMDGRALLNQITPHPGKNDLCRQGADK
jgi:hypothetical protein